jgi:hypothetical protein
VSWKALSVLGVLGVVAVAAFITVAVIAIRYFGDEDAQKVAAQVRHHPLVLEKLGGIDECKMNFAASLNEGGKRTDVFDVRGPKGSGQFVTHERFYHWVSIKLRTAEGEWELLDGRENEIPQNPGSTPHNAEPPLVAREAPVPPATPSQPVVPSPPPGNPRAPPVWGTPPEGFVIAQASTPLKPGTPATALLGATWQPAEVLAVPSDGSVIVHWPHVGHNFNRKLHRSMIAINAETLAKWSSDPDSFTPSVVLAEDSLQPPIAGYVVLPENVKLLPGTPVQINPVGQLMRDYTVVRDVDGQVSLIHDQSPIREEQHSRRKLIIKSTVVAQLAEPEAEQKFAARLKEVQDKNPLLRNGNSNAARMAEQMRKSQPAREYRITIPIPDTAERVTKETPLEVGTRCSAEWGRKWNVVTVKALRDNGDVEVHWEGWSTIELVTRESLTIDKKTLAELIAKQKPNADPNN